VRGKAGSGFNIPLIGIAGAEERRKKREKNP